MEKLPTIGKEYSVAHSRKGTFNARVIAINEPWITVEIMKGQATNMASQPYEVGEQLQIRDAHSTFTPL